MKKHPSGCFLNAKCKIQNAKFRGKADYIASLRTTNHSRVRACPYRIHKLLAYGTGEPVPYIVFYLY